MEKPRILHHEVLGDIVVMDMLTKGGYASIWKGYCVEMRTNICIKLDEKRDHDTEKEFEMMKLLNHPLTCQYYGQLDINGRNAAIIQYIEGQTILQFVNSKGFIKETSARFLFIELLSIMNHLHNELKMIHQDLKCENIIVDTGNNLHLIDFGFAHLANDNTPISHSGCGTPGYIAPEVIMGQPYDFKSDIFSLGVLLYAMLTGTLPFVGANSDEIFKQTLQKTVTYPANISRSAIDLMNGLMNKDPNQRPDIPHIFTHPWLNPYIRGHLYRPSTTALVNLYVFPPNGNIFDRQVLQLLSEYGYDINALISDLRNNRPTKQTIQYIFLRRIQIERQLKNIQFSLFVECQETIDPAIPLMMTGSQIHNSSNGGLISYSHNHSTSQSLTPNKPYPLIIQPKMNGMQKPNAPSRNAYFY